MSAVERATVELLAERGPAAVSIRDIAQRAEINHALVHRHFGTKDELLRTVLRRRSRAIGEAAATLPELGVPAALRLLDQYPYYWRALARTVLDTPDLFGRPDAPGESGEPAEPHGPGHPGELGEPTGFPAAAMFLDLLAGGEPAEGHREAAAVTGALVLGWLLFGDHLARAVGLPDAEGLRSRVSAAAEQLIGRRPPVERSGPPRR